MIVQNNSGDITLYNKSYHADYGINLTKKYVFTLTGMEQTCCFNGETTLQELETIIKNMINVD